MEISATLPGFRPPAVVTTSTDCQPPSDVATASTDCQPPPDVVTTSTRFQPPLDVVTTSTDVSHKRSRTEDLEAPSAAEVEVFAKVRFLTEELRTTRTAYINLQAKYIRLQKCVTVMSADARTMDDQLASQLQRTQTLCHLALYRLRGYPVDCFLREHDCPYKWSELDDDAYTLWDANGDITTTTLTEILALPRGYSPVPTGLDFIPGRAQAFFTPLVYEIVGLQEGPNFVDPYLFFYFDPLAPTMMQTLVVRDKQSGIYHFPCQGHGLYPMIAQAFIRDQLKHCSDRSSVAVSGDLQQKELYRESTDRAFIRTNIFTIVSVTKQEELPRSSASDQMEFVWIAADSSLESEETFNTNLIHPHAAILNMYYSLLQPCINRHIPSKTVTARPVR